MPYTTLITTDALATQLSNDLIVVDCRYDLTNETWGLDEYRRGHIPGAVYASLSHDLAGPRTGLNGRHPLPSVEAMAATFSRLGIDADVQVVAYDQENGMYASRLWWMLRYLGHDAVAVLNGGLGKWVREGRPLRTGDETNQPAAFTPRPRTGWRLEVADVERLVASRSTLLVDARGPERFEGRSEPIDPKAGHIPGARNHYFRQNVADDGTMLPAATLRQQFERTLQGRAPQDVVMYCGSGVTACQNLLALEHAGISGVRLYPGSWSEWSAEPVRPVETGPSRT